MVAAVPSSHVMMGKHECIPSATHIYVNLMLRQPSFLILNITAACSLAAPAWPKLSSVSDKADVIACNLHKSLEAA